MQTRLSDQLLEACAAAEPRLTTPLAAAAVAAARERLADPTLRVAVGGRVKAGKSTLVNALLGRRLAPTRATECTKLAAWFRDSERDRLLVHFDDGRTAEAPASPTGGVPDDLPYDHTQVTHLTVQVRGLRMGGDYVIVDTPGSDALSGLDEYSMNAIRKADALIYVTQDAGAVDLKTLESFRGEMIGARLSALNVVAVLSQIDKIEVDTIGSGAPPAARRARAETIAARAAAQLGGLVYKVVPVGGLLAETTGCADLTDDDVAALVTLAGSGPRTRQVLGLSDRQFLDRLPDVPVDRDTRVRLLQRLDRYGIQHALEAVDAGVTDAAGLRATLERASGIDDLIAVLHEHLMPAVDPIRVDAAAHALEHALAEAGLPWQAADPGERDALAELLDRIAWIRRDPAMQLVALADAARAHALGVLRIDDDTLQDLRRLMTEQTLAGRLGVADGEHREALLAAAAALVGRWKVVEYESARKARHHATLVREMWEHLYFTALQSA